MKQKFFYRCLAAVKYCLQTILQAHVYVPFNILADSAWENSYATIHKIVIKIQKHPTSDMYQSIDIFFHLQWS